MRKAASFAARDLGWDNQPMGLSDTTSGKSAVPLVRRVATAIGSVSMSGAFSSLAKVGGAGPSQPRTFVNSPKPSSLLSRLTACSQFLAKHTC